MAKLRLFADFVVSNRIISKEVVLFYFVGINQLNVWNKMDSNLNAEVRKLSKLKQYRDASEEQLEKLAQKNIVLSELVNSGNFIDEKEKKTAKQCFEKYLEAHDFESYSDLSTLSMLVFNEILVGRIQSTINECTTKDGKTYINDKLVKSLHEAENQVLSLKTKLRIDKEEKVDEFTALQLLKKRFHNWIQENRNECTLVVPFKCLSCGKDDVKMVLLRKRIKDFEELDHPMFSGRFWYNAKAMNDVENGILSKEKYAEYFATSVDYVNWCLENKGRILPNIDEKKS